MKNEINFCQPARENYQLISRFEKEFARQVKSKYCIATNSGYTALFLSLWALGIREGDEVIVPNFTMIATANAVMACGAKPVFVEVEYETGNIDANRIEEAITKNTKAIIPVHIYGHPCDMARVNKIAGKYKLKVIEDAAEAHGAKFKNKYCGSLGDAGCFSFYANKIISTGEGGAVTTNSRKVAGEIAKFRSYYFGHGYWHEKIGWSFRMNPYGAREGLKQLLTFDSLVNKRREIARFYNKNLKDKVIKPVEKDYAKNVYWMYHIKVQNKLGLENYLKSKGIETRDCFVPLNMQTPYLKKRELGPTGFTGTPSDKIYSRGILLPSMPNLTKKELKYVCDSVNSFFG